MGQKERDKSMSKAIADAMYDTDITKLPGWDRVVALSSRTEFKEIDVLEDIVIWNDDVFECGANIYIRLNFDGEDEPLSFTGEYPGSFWGHIEGDKPIIDRISIDTTSSDV